MLDISLQKRLHSAQGEMLLDVQIKSDWGKVINLFGPSGAGKTSILRMLAGLMPPDAGRIHIKGDVWFDSIAGKNKKPQQRRLGFIFQDYALFPNMTVKENLTYALDKGQSNAIVNELIELIELEPLQDRLPSTLSGGQQQRVALARALVRKPDLLLLDEPLSALDQSMRRKLQGYILDLQEKYALTTIWVSHDVGEVFKMSDLVLVIEEGLIVRQGTPSEIFSTEMDYEADQYIGRITEMGTDELGVYAKVRTDSKIHLVYLEQGPTSRFNIGDTVAVTTKYEFALIHKI